MASPAPIALGPYLLLVRVILFLVLVPAGIQNLSMMTFEGVDADRVRQLREGAPTTPQLVQPESTPVDLAGTNQQAEAEEYPARRLYTIALRMEDMGWDNPGLLAWIGALTQLIGGGLLLPGLMTRVWGLALSVVVGALFVLGSWPLVGGSLTAFIHLDRLAANQVGLHLCLFGLSLAMVVCGGGGISIDRLIFGKPRRRTFDLVTEDDAEDPDT